MKAITTLKSTKTIAAKTVFFVIAIGMFVGNAGAAEYYMATNGSNTTGDGSSGNEWLTLQHSMAQMSGGDTLIIRDGVYTGEDNTLNSTHKPPNGNATAYTQIRAEHFGEVTFDGQDENNVFNLSRASYINFGGIIWCNENFIGAGTLVGLEACNHIKFICCGAYDAHDGDDGHVFSSYGCTDLLYEECYAWGAGDYAFMPARDTERVVYRRCVSRQDRQKDWIATIGFFPYGSRNVEFQNCVYVDADNDISYYSSRPFPWAIRYAGQGFELENVNFAGCLSINAATGGVVQGSLVSVNTTVLFSNCVSMGTYQGSRLRYDGANFDHCTFYNISAPMSDTWGRGVYFEGQGSNERNTISNSIIAEVTNNIALLKGVSQYNCLYNNSVNYSGTSDMSGDKTTIDPLSNSLFYPLRIENSSDLDGAASDGGDIGATILKRIGKSGTLWGEEGYNLLQDGTNGQADESLWPFPNEDIIKEHMKAYSYDNGNLTGNRGFCADGNGLYGGPITLTSYIWEYLGNPCPADICAYGADTTPPARSNPSPSTELPAGTTSTAISLSTNESATCKYSTTANTAYTAMTNTFTTTGGISHSTVITGLEDGQTYTYYVRAEDTAGNANTDDYVITFSVATQGVGDPGDDGGDDSSGGGCFIGTTAMGE